MKVKELLKDDDAVSPVIGVILMVAITVILAAVIGAFVLNLGATQASAPKAKWSVNFNDGGDGFGSGDDNDLIKLSHNGGDDVSKAQLTFQIGNTEVNPTNNPPSTLGAGDVVKFDEDGSSISFQSSDSFTVTWQSPDGGKSQILVDKTVPSS